MVTRSGNNWAALDVKYSVVKFCILGGLWPFGFWCQSGSWFRSRDLNCIQPVLC